MSSVEDAYPIPCAFCAISKAYPSEPNSPVPRSPDPDKLSPQCHLILSAPHVLAFLDIMPIAPGHILVTTRRHYRKLSDLQPPPPTAKNSPNNDSAQLVEEEARETARALGQWLPIVSRALCAVTGVEDWNVVQNNGERAAQVVPHIHFHLIPRYQEGREETKRNGGAGMAMMKSWKMFGRGSREDLDDEEGAELARLLREAIQSELDKENRGESKL